MLIYQFRCKHCRNLFEESDKTAEVECCGEIAPRIYMMGGISFKGSGFHRNDYRG